LRQWFPRNRGIDGRGPAPAGGVVA